MKFRCERDLLVETVGTTSRAVSTRSGGIQALAGLRFELSRDLLHITGADSDLDLVIEADTRVNGLEEGQFVVDARLVSDIVRSFDPGAVSVDSDDEEVRIVSGRSQFGVKTYPSDDYPKLPPIEGAVMSMPGGQLADALRQVVRAASRNDMRQQFTGVLFSAEDKGLRLVATDSYRLAMRDLGKVEGMAGDFRSVVPARALGEVQRLLGVGSDDARDMTFRNGDVHVAFDVGQVRVRTRLIKADFPEYRQLVPPNYPNRATLPKETFLDALRRMRLMVRDDSSSVRVSLGADGLRLMVVHPDMGRADEDVDAKYEGNEMTVAFNPSFLIDGVEPVAGDEVVLETVDATKPAMVRGIEGDEYRYLLMPVRIP